MICATFIPSHWTRAISSFPPNDRSVSSLLPNDKTLDTVLTSSLHCLANTRSKLKNFQPFLPPTKTFSKPLITQKPLLFLLLPTLPRSWRDLTQSSGSKLHSNANNLFKLVLHLAPLHSVWDCVTPLAGNIIIVESASPGYLVLTVRQCQYCLLDCIQKDVFVPLPRNV